MSSVVRQPSDRRLEALVMKIQTGDCVLVLGPRIAAPVEVAGERVSIADDLAGKLLEDLGQASDGSPIGLRQAIASYERANSPQACRSLVQSLVREYDGHTTPLHDDLAALPFRLVLCATADILMEEALRRSGKTDVVSAYYDHHPGSAGRTLMALPTVAAPIVYSLFGRHDHPESMVLNDQNLLDYLVSVTKENPPLPDAVRATLRAPSTVFLFVGFGFENWWLRLLLKVLSVTGVESRGVSLAFEESRTFASGQLEESKGFFQSAGIYIQAGDWNALAKDLRSRVVVPAATTTAAPGAAALEYVFQGAPWVFLSYASEDLDHVTQLRTALTDAGLNVWQDKHDLRGGQDWEREISKVIARVHAFVFVQTEAMDSRDAAAQGGVYYEELKLALKKSDRLRPGQAFIFHVTIGRCRPLEDLSNLHRLKVDDEAGRKALANDIWESFKSIAAT